MATDEKKECLRCGGSMDVGFVIDHTINNRPGIPVWLEGTPGKEFWTALNLDTYGKRVFKVVTYRCAKCGRLESFTGEPHI